MTSVLRAFATPGCTIGRVAALAVLAGMLGGCATKQVVDTGAPDDYRRRHPITVQEGTRTVEMFVGRSRGSLTAAQRTEAFGFAQAWERDATGGIVIEVPSGTPNDRAADGALHEIQGILAAAGVPSGVVAVRRYRPVDPMRLATVRLNYPRMTAEAGPCGLWPHDLGPADVHAWVENKEYWNLGCAAQRNLAAMVDNPADLVQPRSEGPAYPARRSVILDKFRKGESTATTYPNAGAGKISDVGK